MSMEIVQYPQGEPLCLFIILLSSEGRYIVSLSLVRDNL